MEKFSIKPAGLQPLNLTTNYEYTPTDDALNYTAASKEFIFHCLSRRDNNIYGSFGIGMIKSSYFSANVENKLRTRVDITIRIRCISQFGDNFFLF